MLGVLCVFTCLRARVLCVLTCLACLFAYVLTCLACLRAYVLGVLVMLVCLACLRAYELTCLASLRAYVLGELACVRAWLLRWNVLFSYVFLHLVFGVLFCLICFTFQYLNLKILRANKLCALLSWTYFLFIYVYKSQ